MPLANPIRGQVAVPGGDLILSYSANALVTLEQELDAKVEEIGELLLGPGAGLKDLRTIFWCGLLDHQPDTTVVDAGLLMTEVGFDRVGELVGRAYIGAFPQPKAGGGAPVADPRKAAAGAGPRSSKPGRTSGSTRSSSGG